MNLPRVQRVKTALFDFYLELVRKTTFHTPSLCSPLHFVPLIIVFSSFKTAFVNLNVLLFQAFFLRFLLTVKQNKKTR